MNATLEATGTYRKTRDGEWVVMAPRDYLASMVATRDDIAADEDSLAAVKVVTKAGKEKFEVIRHVGRGFDVDGVEMAYGYIWDAFDINNIRLRAQVR